MKVLRNRIGKLYDRHLKIFEAATLPLSFKEKTAFIDAYYKLPGVTDFIDKKVEEYDEASGEPVNKFVDRMFFEYKAEYERKNKVCR